MRQPVLFALMSGAVAAAAIVDGGGGGGRCTQATSPAADALQAALDAAIRAGQSAFTVEPATAPLCFGNTSLVVSRATGLVIDLGGNALVFAVGGGVLVRDSVRVTITGATISYDPPTAAQGVIASTFGPAGSRGTLVSQPRPLYATAAYRPGCPVKVPQTAPPNAIELVRPVS